MNVDLFKTDNKIEIPLQKVAKMRPERRIAINNRIKVLNSPGTIETVCRKKCRIVLINLSKKEFVKNDKEGISKMDIERHKMTEWINVKNFVATDIDSGGFVHIGKEM